MTRDNIVRIVGAIDNIVEKTMLRMTPEKAKSFAGTQETEKRVEKAVLDCLITDMFTSDDDFISDVISCL